jgi:hypothetical protein
MNEFKDRMAAQRAVLTAVNTRPQTEELFGLSSKAIDRWALANHVTVDSKLRGLVESASSKLFFLANKSQEQISEDYRTVCTDIAALTEEIEREVKAATRLHQ